MAKNKKMSTIPSKTKEVKLVPQDLKDKWGSITAIATACNCLDVGMYHHKYTSTVRSSIAYLAKLHETLVEDALKHPQAHMISELKEIQKQMNQAKKEAKNGTTKKGAVIGSIDPTGNNGTGSIGLEKIPGPGETAIHPAASSGEGCEAPLGRN